MNHVERIQHALDEAESGFPLQVAQARTLGELELVRVQFLGRKSEFTAALKHLPELTPEQRATLGKRANELRASFDAQLAAKRQALTRTDEDPVLDVTLPGSALAAGRLHPLTQTTHAILGIFTSMGFEIAEGPEMELEYYNFDALNIPRDHPSRESFDTFFVDLPSPTPAKGRLLLRSHTSPVQVRVMEQRQPPLRIVVPGTVYRPDALDPSHSFMFHQIEGLMVDTAVSFADLKGVLDAVLRALFGANSGVGPRFVDPAAGNPVAVEERFGAITLDLLHEWLGAVDHVSLRPVLHVLDPAVGRHPPPMRRPASTDHPDTGPPDLLSA